MSATSIQWTDCTWNPVRGCTRVSEGCRNCYAERQAARFSDRGQYAHGFVERTRAGPRWTGRVELVEEKLREPLSWKKPRRVFVNSMSDLFHESLSDDAIAAIFGVMAAAPLHTFQILTKRPERMRAWFERVAAHGGIGRYIRRDDRAELRGHFSRVARTEIDQNGRRVRARLDPWMQVMNAAACNFGPDPLHNVWLGVSCEDQATADARIPLLLDTPAAVRFLSVEPLLGPVDLKPFLWASSAATCRQEPRGDLHWMIVGGESGPGARPCDVAWIRSIVEQCKAAGTACFVKQLGASPYERVPSERGAGGLSHREKRAEGLSPGPDWTLVTSGVGQEWMRYHQFADRKGGSMEEWPEDLRIREMPEALHA